MLSFAIKAILAVGFGKYFHDDKVARKFKKCYDIVRCFELVKKH